VRLTLTLTPERCYGIRNLASTHHLDCGCTTCFLRDAIDEASANRPGRRRGYYDDHIDYNLVAPGSICADHGCTIVHPELPHADYVREFNDHDRICHCNTCRVR
jgi:hypothetical protein